MKQLDFTLSLIDKMTRPLKQAQAGVSGFADSSRRAFTQVGVGVGGLVGAGMAIKGALDPAIQVFDTLQEASARGVSDAALKQISGQALQFSTTYGTVAEDFIRSSADIRSAIGGLSDTELPKITAAANLVAKAVGATTEESTEFFGQMFSNFRAQADAMGKVNFAEQLAGKMTYMRKEFGAGMAEIKDLMEGARGVGSNYGVSMAEQLAVMGELRKTLGTEASGSYEGFLTGAVEGAKKLGLSFTDANGQLLSMPDMLQKLQGRYGASIEGNLKAQAELDEAFGDSAAVIKQLYGNVGTLQRHITGLGGNDGLKRTQEMAEKMTKPWDRLMAIWRAIRIAIGLTLLPVLYPLINTVANAGQQFAKWMQMFPSIARLIGIVTLAVLGFAAMAAVANIVVGVGRFAMLGFGIVLSGLRGVLMAVRLAAFLTGVAFNFLSLPVLLVVGAIALLALGFYALIANWGAVSAGLVAGWQWVCEQFEAFSPLAMFNSLVDSIKNIFSGLWDWLIMSFLDSFKWILEKLNLIPGVEVDASAVEAKPATMSPDALTGGQVQGIQRGGISKEISSNSKTSSVTDNRKSIGLVTIHNGQGMTPQQLMEWQETQA